MERGYVPTCEQDKGPVVSYSYCSTAPKSVDGFISASVLALKAKAFDDGLYAAVEVLAHEGGRQLASKRDLIKEIVGSVLSWNPQDRSHGMNVLAGACLLSNCNAQYPPDLQAAASAAVGAHLASEIDSKPLGFYTWSPLLQQIFRHDRLLQQAIAEEELASIIDVIRNTDSIKSAYLSHIDLISRMTNSLVGCGLTSAIGAPEWQPKNQMQSFFPASQAPETELLKSLMSGAPMESGSLIDELLLRLRKGRLHLTPKKDSGWYEYQLWALEALALISRMPESAHLSVSHKYQQRLDELFKGLYALTRETHVKQVEMLCSGLPLVLTPELRVEPLPSFYLRRAMGYNFIKQHLVRIIGKDDLRSISRITCDGYSNCDLLTELNGMALLFLGAYIVSCDDLSMPYESSPEFPEGADVQLAAEVFSNWAAEAGTDPDVAGDARMMVPVSYEGGSFLVWTFLGWSSVNLNVSFARPPRIVSAVENGQVISPDRIYLELTSRVYQAAYPVMAEVVTDRLLNRDEFRQLCDTAGSAAEIINRLRTSASLT